MKIASFVVVGVTVILLIVLVDGRAGESRRHRNQAVCQLDAQTGNCRAAHTRWYYDKLRGECRTFTWGGCGGNANRFATKQLCESRCKADAVDITGCPSRRCRKNCEHGFIIDAQGCTRCACKADPNSASCPEIECPERCANGYQRDERDCMTCDCRDSSQPRPSRNISEQCPPVCAMACRYPIRRTQKDAISASATQGKKLVV